MFKISNHIFEEIKDSNIEIKRIRQEEKELILNCISKKYIDSNKKGNFLWERFSKCEALSDSKAWSYLKDFVKDNDCIMFFEHKDDDEMLLIQSGNDLDYILSETYGFEFYIIDRECSYLLCFNHHDILYGCGKAIEWIISLKIN